METFRWEPFHTPTVTHAHRVKTSAFENGTARRYYKGKGPRTWSLKFQVTYAEATEIVDFFDAMKGPYTAFLYLDPHSGQYVKVHFKDDSLTLETEWKYNGFLTVNLEEIL